MHYYIKKQNGAILYNLVIDAKQSFLLICLSRHRRKDKRANVVLQNFQFPLKNGKNRSSLRC
jgi:hypothetical protein